MIKLEGGRISGLQLAFCIAAFIQGSLLLTSFVIGITKHESWIVVITGMIASIPIIWMYLVLARKFPGRDLFEINQLIFGRFIGKAFSVMYLLFFMSLFALNSRDVGGFVVGYLMPETPSAVIIIMFIFICAWAVRSGIENIARYSFLLVAVTSVIILLNIALLIKDMNMSNFLPLFQLSPIKYLQGTHIIAIIPICEIMVFLMITPHVNDYKKTKRAVFTGMFIGAATMLVIVLRDIAVLGPIATIVTLPSFEAVRLINVADILTRMEVYFAISYLTMQFFKISILYYVVVLGLSRLFGLRTYRPLVSVVGILGISLSMIVFDSTMENTYWGSNIAPFYSSFFEVVLPALSLIIAQLRGMKGRGELKNT